MPPLFDDFNRAGPGLGPDYFDVTDLTIQSNELYIGPDGWGESYRSADSQFVPATVEFDFWVPDDPFDGYHGYEVDVGFDVWVYIDNQPTESPTQWGCYIAGNPTDWLEFSVEGDTYYHIKAVVSKSFGDTQQVKIWKVGDPEPEEWDHEVVREASATHTPATYVYMDSAGSIYPSRMDNIYIFGPETVVNDVSFTAKSVLRYPLGHVGSIHKLTTLHVLKKRPFALSAFVPPRTPDEDEGVHGGEHTPSCLPGCAGVSIGGIYGATSNIVKRPITYCSHCTLFFRTDTEYLGRGSDIASATHCGYCGDHQRLDHLTKLFVDYGALPKDKFRMRAKLTWDQDTSDVVSVRVYANVPSMPNVDVDECVDFGDGTFNQQYWIPGDLVGTFTFIAEAEGTLGGRDVQYQRNPSEIALDGGALNNSILRFQLSDNTISPNAKFRAANLDMDIT